jgi:hypothetical protein
MGGGGEVLSKDLKVLYIPIPYPYTRPSRRKDSRLLYGIY